MIHVTIFENKEKTCVGFHAQGHADYADEGNDIVCAAASVLIINTVNAIEMYTEDSFTLDTEQKSGLVDCRFTDPTSEETDLLLNTMILGLSSMADDDQYADYIDLTFQEVQ